MPYIQPTFMLDTRLWETDDGITAKSLRELQRKLPDSKHRIKDYYPAGFGAQVKPRTSPNVAKVSLTSYQRKYPPRPRSAPVPIVSETKVIEPVAQAEPVEAVVEVEQPEVQVTPDLFSEPIVEVKKPAVVKAVVPEEVEFPRRPKPKRQYRLPVVRKPKQSWSAEDDAKLAKLVEEGFGDIAIAHQLNRSTNAVIGRRHRKGIYLNRK